MLLAHVVSYTISMPPISISVFQLLLLPRVSFKIKSQSKTKTITRWCFQGASIRTPSLAIYCISYLVFISPARISSCVSACWDRGYHATWIGRSTGRCLYQHFTVCLQGGCSLLFQPASGTLQPPALSWIYQISLQEATWMKNICTSRKPLENQFFIRTVQVCSHINDSNPGFLNTCPYRDIPASWASLWVRRAFTRAPSSGLAWGAATFKFLSDPPP